MLVLVLVLETSVWLVLVVLVGCTPGGAPKAYDRLTGARGESICINDGTTVPDCICAGTGRGALATAFGVGLYACELECEYAGYGPWEGAHICVGCEYMEDTLLSLLYPGCAYAGGGPCEGAHTCVGCDHIECPSVWGQRSAVDTACAACVEAPRLTGAACVEMCFAGVGLSGASYRSTTSSWGGKYCDAGGT